MLRNLFTVALCFILSFSSLAGQDFHTFKDKTGREMEAKLTRVSGQDVYIERKDGLSTKVDKSIFSPEDQKYIEEWARKNLLTSGIFSIRFTTENTKKKKSSSGGIDRESYESAYGIEVSNSSYETIKNIQIEYLVIKFEDALAAQKRSEGELKRLKGKTKIDFIGARDKSTAVTESFPMQETKLAPGYVWAGGGKKTSKDKLDGIWVKLYIDGILVHEESRPESMMRKTAW
ncbi:MAG: hypothetical protein ACSHYA_00990 [Opitutaceae bacterium]